MEQKVVAMVFLFVGFIALAKDLAEHSTERFE